ncbi:MAG: GWxTD domain-containing protein [Candidatus Aminicenantes bacterium]|nr:GWxTD domain-containing protein [Candidatus Aminicenantes bacterium]
MSLYRMITRGRSFKWIIPALFLLVIISLSFLFQTSCHYYNLERKLDPEDSDWFNRVRYIITKQESKIFLELPDSEREQFKEEFWERRDPDPQTKINEFKVEYYQRMERADEIFMSEGIPGYRTDRGRIYILFGPPMNKLTDYVGSNGVCREVWYYGAFPVVFVDNACMGKFILVTYNLSPIRELNLEYMQALSKAQDDAQQTIQKETRYFDFQWSVERSVEQDDRVEAKIHITIPYVNIWLRQNDNILETSLLIKLELFDSDQQLIWEHDGSFPIQIEMESIGKIENENLYIDIPMVITDKLEKLRQGTNKLFITLKNTTGDAEQKKTLDFSIK